MGPTRDPLGLSASGGPHVDAMNLATGTYDISLNVGLTTSSTGILVFLQTTVSFVPIKLSCAWIIQSHGGNPVSIIHEAADEVCLLSMETRRDSTFKNINIQKWNQVSRIQMKEMNRIMMWQMYAIRKTVDITWSKKVLFWLNSK